jgi:glutathione S-transferase
MTLTLYFHPLSSFCMKVLIALYENDTPFKPQIVDFSNAAQAAEFRSMWPVGKFPVLRDEAGDRMIPESSIIIEYLDQHYPGRTRFLPADPDAARQMRFRDRFFDLYVQGPMQKIVGDRLRPQGKKDELGVEQATARWPRTRGRWAMLSAWPTAPPHLRSTTRTSLRRSSRPTRTRQPTWTA